MYGWPFPPPWNTQRDAGRDTSSQLVHSLRELLVDNHKVLKGLVDYLERLKKTPDDQYSRKPKKEELIPLLIEEGRSMCWDIWRDTYKQPVGYTPPEFKDREMLRHSRRLLNFAYQYVLDLLAQSEKHKTQGYQKDYAKQAVGMSERFVSSLAPENGLRHYRHPEAPKWERLLGQAERRMSDLWLARAHAHEADAKSRSTVHKLPLKIEGATWEQVEKLGFRRVKLCDDQLHQEVYLPFGWTRERIDDQRARLLDHKKRPRAEIDFAGAEGPSVKFVRRYQIVEMTDETQRWFRVVDHAFPESANSWLSDTYKTALDKDPKWIRESAEQKAGRGDSNPVEFEDY
jgi:hypothetical protein